MAKSFQLFTLFAPLTVSTFQKNTTGRVTQTQKSDWLCSSLLSVNGFENGFPRSSRYLQLAKEGGYI